MVTANQKQVIDWLLSDGPSWVKYHVLSSSQGRSESDSEVLHARKELDSDPFILRLVEDAHKWPEPPLTGHNKWNHPSHTMELLATLLPKGHPELKKLAEHLLEQTSSDGIPLTLMNIPERFGGTGKPDWLWMTCDYPLLLWIILRADMHSEVQGAIDHLLTLCRPNGWKCASSISAGFKGPGSKNDPCPYGNLLALKVLSEVPEMNDSEEAKHGIGMLLWHWENSHAKRPYMFGSGKRYRKLKFPAHWYDVVHVAWVLSRFESVRTEPAFKDMFVSLQSRADENGRYTPESVYMCYKGQDFSQKKNPSPTLTWYIRDILRNHV